MLASWLVQSWIDYKHDISMSEDVLDIRLTHWSIVVAELCGCTTIEEMSHDTTGTPHYHWAYFTTYLA